MNPKERVDADALIKPNPKGYHPDGPGLEPELDDPEFLDGAEAFVEAPKGSTTAGTMALVCGIIAVVVAVLLWPVALVALLLFAFTGTSLFYVLLAIAGVCLVCSVAAISLGSAAKSKGRQQGYRASGALVGLTLGIVSLGILALGGSLFAFLYLA